MLELLSASPSLQPLLEGLKSGDSLVMEELWDVPKAIILAEALRRTGKNILVVSGGARESRLYDDFALLTSAEVAEFPAWETLPTEGVAPSPDIVGERYAVLARLLQSKGATILLAPLQACLQRVLPKEQLRKLMRHVRVNDEIVFSEFVAELEKMGFERRVVASDKGEFAVRGGIIDLFPVDSPDPYRIEFFGNTVESMRRYDPVGQRSVSPASEVSIFPAKEAELLKQSATPVSILDYLGPQTIVVFDDLLALEDRYAALQGLPGLISSSFLSFHGFLEEVENYQKIYFPSTPLEELGELKMPTTVRPYSAAVRPYPVSFSMFDVELKALRVPSPFRQPEELFAEGEEPLLTALEKAPALGYQLHLVAETESDIQHYQPQLPKGTKVVQGYLSSGFALEEERLCVVSIAELTQRQKIRRRKQRSTYHTPVAEFRQLQEGELVVHYEHGIGKYLGVERHTDHTGAENEFLAVEYAEKGKLFVPLTQSHLVSRYIGGHEEQPKLSKLGSTRWAKARSVTEVAIRDYAAQLLQLHAERELRGGHAFLPDGDELQRFELDFPYQETEDQLAAIRDVKADMESAKAMDRLLCGDVGYGKTEVAMRAAFKAVEGGKQVAVLVPTTVLALQHYETFSERMSNFPVKVGILSRFSSAKETKKTLEELGSGALDIVVGTHRLVGADVAFKDLGLVILDEEQRFGVRVKEKLRAFKAGVDCLTLTATPIPRTLYLSLMGARDLSIIQTPPQDRLPIKTLVCPLEDERLKSALLRELARDGQAYVVHNRVETLHLFVDRIKRLLPAARVATAHGQMDADELDTVFHAFKTGVVDVLVATTIVENGIDIPNANTILIDRADRYGLADLYQLRGRVGRWSRQAYAYFLVPENRVLSEVSEKRLKALLEIGGYGGGMKLAMRDLEIRGAGNILGVEQSGHVTRIGFNLYCRLLQRMVNNLKGGNLPSLDPVKLEFPQEARLPELYVSDSTLRMEFYQRFGEAESEEELERLLAEVKDRFGPPPSPVIWLYHIMRVRLEAQRQNIAALKLKNLTLHIEYRNKKKRSVLFATQKTPTEFERQVKSAIVTKRHG